MLFVACATYNLTQAQNFYPAPTTLHISYYYKRSFATVLKTHCHQASACFNLVPSDNG
jgi:hypothetical protein